MTVKTISDPQELIAYLHKLIWLSMQSAVYFGNVVDGKDDWGKQPTNHFAIGGKVFYWATLEDHIDEDLEMLVDAVEAHAEAGATALASLRNRKPRQPDTTKEVVAAKQWLEGRTPLSRASDVVEANPTAERGKSIAISLAAPRYTKADERVEFLSKLITLAADETIFFGSYNRDIQDWDNDAHPVINLGDTFAYACADAEDFHAEELDLLVDAHQKFQQDGVNAFAAVRRGAEVIEPLRTKRYLAALEFVRSEHNRS